LDLKKALIEKRSKKGVQELAAWVGTDAARFKELWELMASREEPYASYAAWVFDYCLQENPQLIEPHFEQAIAALEEAHHEAIYRNILKHLAVMKIPEDYQGLLYDYSLNAIGNPQKSIAVRVHSMEIAFQIGKAWPELLEELQQVLEAHIGEGSAGFRSRGGRILKRIQKIRN
jgi:hypothetical protein